MRINLNLRIFLLQVGLSSLTFLSCTSKPQLPPDQLTTRSGYKLNILDRVSDQKATDAEYIMYTSDIMIGDTIINTSLLTGPCLFYEVKEISESQIVSPVVEAFQLMNSGDSAVLIYPLSADENKPEYFKDAMALDYRIRILRTMNAEDYGVEFNKIRDQINEEATQLLEREPEITELTKEIWSQLKEGKFDNELIDLGQGVKVLIHEEGNGNTPDPGAFVSVAYFGRLANSGEAFDNSFKRGKRYKFKLGVGTSISGLDIAILQLSEGTKATLIIPSEMGYGKQGFPPSIGPDENLHFYVELDEIIK